MKKITVAPPQVDLRRGIDHIGVTVCFVVHDGKGKILLQKRSQNCRDERGNWDIGGGAVEFGESIEAAVEREIREELLTQALDIKFLGAYDAHRMNHEKEKTHWIALVHAIHVDPKQVQIGEPHKIDEIGWFSAQNLPSPVHSQFHKSFVLAQATGIVT